jgi:hypothetical protein
MIETILNTVMILSVGCGILVAIILLILLFVDFK